MEKSHFQKISPQAKVVPHKYGFHEIFFEISLFPCPLSPNEVERGRRLFKADNYSSNFLT